MEQADLNETMSSKHWVTELLHSNIVDWNELNEYDTIVHDRSTKNFLERCTNSAHTAHKIARLREARFHFGFAPVSIVDYLKGLANSTKIALPPILQTFGIRQLTDEINVVSIKKWIRLLKALDVSLDEARAYIGISIARKHGFVIEMARRENNSELADSPQAYLKFIHELFVQNGHNGNQEWTQMEAEIQKSYGRNIC